MNKTNKRYFKKRKQFKSLHEKNQIEIKKDTKEKEIQKIETYKITHESKKRI